MKFEAQLVYHKGVAKIFLEIFRKLTEKFYNLTVTSEKLLSSS